MKKSFKIFASVIIAASVSVLTVFSSFAVEVKENKTYTWTMIDDKWSVTDINGDPVKGWAVHNEQIYYLSNKGVMKTGWVKDGGSWYYLYNKDDADADAKLNSKNSSYKSIYGTLATNTWIDNYYVDSEGVMTKTK